MTDTRRLRKKTARIIRVLGTFLGTPRRPGRRPPPLDMLIATILSQNTSDTNSHRAYAALRSAFPRWSDAARAPVPAIRKAIRPGGLANKKSLTITSALRAIMSSGGTPRLAGLRSMSAAEIVNRLTALPGVGVKTASCVLLFSLGRDVCPVDTHVHRIVRRLGLVPGKGGPDATFRALQPLIPRGRAYAFHTNLIRFGRSVCRAQAPRCAVCPLFRECTYGPRHRLRRSGSRSPVRRRDFMLLDNVR